jgi:hypothetical protein
MPTPDDFMQSIAIRNQAAAKPTVVAPAAGLPMMGGPQALPPQGTPPQGAQAQPGGPSIEDKISQFAQSLTAEEQLAALPILQQFMQAVQSRETGRARPSYCKAPYSATPRGPENTGRTGAAEHTDRDQGHSNRKPDQPHGYLPNSIAANYPGHGPKDVRAVT